MNDLYDTIGLNYARLRQPDARISRKIDDALGAAQTVLNVGAGAGSYEPENRQVTAVEPSAEMIAQRPLSTASVFQASAEDLPFGDNSFDAAMAVLTIHHWSDKEKGVREMRRVARGRIVFLTYDPAFRGFWLADYFPALVTLDEGQMPPLTDYGNWLDNVTITPMPIPHDCTDGFLAGYWRRPAAYLEERVRAAMSSFWAIGDVSDGLNRLEKDLKSGAWEERYASLIPLDALDCGYRLITADETVRPQSF
ncbi:class I SAM-dependent methyltransferase [Sneathiella marina]|uniref:Class I SAM-dependent methyltransferase n=1 Tax=Sneathiella marina TaxID=2950108 RepID=A0ABY4W2G8_9PROT|nr:class I SAM-dependent methyltransferase [Sneathiella marina]USG61119.1 class I SAM-dependent methyltransferase [Sneathiella marina]